MSPAHKSVARRLTAAAATAVVVAALNPFTPGLAQNGPATVTASPAAVDGTDWTATWIGRDNPAVWPRNGEQNPAPLLRKRFGLGAKVSKARLSIVGLGYYEAWVNGRRVGDQVLDPAPSQYNKTAFSRTFDVTASLQKGANVIGVELGRGYFGMPNVGGDSFGYPSAPWRSEPRLLAQLDVTLTDGSTQRVTSDGSWKIADSPTHDNLYFGETYDARLNKTGWKSASYDDSAWQSAPEQAAPTESVVPATTPPVKVTQALKPVKVTRLANGASVYDFGRHTAGWSRITATGHSGTTVRMVYGEQLNDDGSVFQFQAEQDDERHVDAYTLAGTSRQTWEPSFTRHGFRYIQVSSTTPLSSFAIEARLTHTAVKNTGSFASSNSLLNWIHGLQRASLLDNMWGIPTDTPWRDRQGWTADAYLYLDSAALNFGVKELYEDWLRTYRDTQLPDGSLPVIVPNPGSFPLYNDPSWSGTLVLDAWTLYQHYGDEQVLADNYDAMTRWMDLMATKIAESGNLYGSFSFGDWASPGSEARGTGLFAPEKSDLTANADLYHEARTLARVARELGHTDDAATYNALADDIEAAFNAKFFDSVANEYVTVGNPYIGGGAPGYRQTSNLVALAYGLVPEGHEDAVLARLVRDIRERDYDLDTGAIGTKLLLPVLTEHGKGGLAYRLANQTDYPSWGNWLEEGATTSWETWSITSRDQSMNHAFLGTVDDWFYQHLVGIRPAAPGYAKVLVAPVFPEGLTHASASVTSPRGKIGVRWERKDGHLTLTVQVPLGTPTEVRLPSRSYRVNGGTHVFRVS